MNYILLNDSVKELVLSIIFGLLSIFFISQTLSSISLISPHIFYPTFNFSESTQEKNQTIEIRETTTTTSTTTTIPPETTTTLVQPPSHLVITRVQLSPSELIQLYNPLDESINLENIYLVYFSSKRDWNGPSRVWKLPNRTINAHSYFSINVFNFSGADWNLLTKKGKPYSLPQLNDLKGSVGIFPFNPKNQDIEKVKESKIDVVGWGTTKVYEGEPFPIKKNVKVIERKIAWFDTDNNKNDFIGIEKPYE